MTAAKLWLLLVLTLQFFTDAIEKLDVGLLWILLECRNEGPGHGASSLSSNAGV